METAKIKIQACVRDIDRWMVTNRLKLNSDKTEVLVLSAAHRPRPPIGDFQICNDNISPSSAVRNIGVIFDENMSLEKHITSVCKSCFFHIRNISKIRKYLSPQACITLVHAFITSKLDFCNSLLYGLPKSPIQKLQHVQNAAARVVSLSRKYDHITPVLYRLNWLPVEQRIEFKLLLLTFKALHNTAPSYLRELIEPYVPSRSLRSSNLNFLSKPVFKLKSYGKRSFSCAAPELWNSLPLNIRSVNSLSTFKKLVKTWLFRRTYDL